MNGMGIGTKVKLNNGSMMPLLGFGTYQIKPGKTTYDAVSFALKSGYRHIDTAKYYGNEESVGQAIRDSGMPREEIWVTTKLWPNDALRVEKAFKKSFDKLDIGYIDLYLVHWPVPGMIKKVWSNMENLYKESGKIKAIGVSNHSVSQLKCILDNATVKPVVNQVKCSPYNYNPKMYEFCKNNGVVMEAYSPLTQGRKLNDLKLAEIAEKYSKSPAQILLRWCVQKGIITIPKSIHENRIVENMDIFGFELSEKDIEKLDNFSNK